MMLMGEVFRLHLEVTCNFFLGGGILKKVGLSALLLVIMWVHVLAYETSGICRRVEG